LQATCFLTEPYTSYLDIAESNLCTHFLYQARVTTSDTAGDTGAHGGDGPPPAKRSKRVTFPDQLHHHSQDPGAGGALNPKSTPLEQVTQ
jgi:hypothetical protein